MALPSLHVEDIPGEGLAVDCEVEGEELGLPALGVLVRGPFSLHVDILPVQPSGPRAKTGHDVKSWLARGHLRGSIQRQCVRCLKEYDDSGTFPFAVQYEVRKGAAGSQEKRSRPEARHALEDVEALAEGEVYSIIGKEIDLAPMLREQVILGSPMQPLCQEGCQGLCAVCGNDRNLHPCACAEARPSNPFAILKDLKTRARQ